MKSKEELKQIKKEYTELNKKLSELSEDELKQVIGGENHGGSTQKVIGIWDVAVKLK